jgi:hypothetical protein
VKIFLGKEEAQAQEEQQLPLDQWERRDLDCRSARPDSVGEVHRRLANNHWISCKGVIAIRSMRRRIRFNPRISRGERTRKSPENTS